MAASLHFLSLNPQTLSHHSAAAATAAPSSFAIFTVKPLPKSNRSLSASNCGVVNINYATPTSKFSTKVAFSSDLDLDEDDFSGPGEGSLSPDLKLFVGNLPFNVDSAALAGLFQQAGNVEEVEVIYDRLSGRSRGFGFVTMSRIEEAEAAVQQFNGYELQGRPLRVNSGPPPAKRENSSFRENPSFRENSSSFRENSSSFRENSSFRGAGGPRGRTGSGDANRVYVGNLSWGVDDLALETLFSEQGKVKEARVVYDRESGRSKGFGFVTLSSPDEVNNAIESLDGADLNGRPIRVSAAESRDSRDSRPRRQY